MGPAPGLILVPVLTAVLLLTYAEYVRGLKRGKWWKRTHATARREAAALTLKTPQAPRGPRRSRCRLRYLRENGGRNPLRSSVRGTDPQNVVFGGSKFSQHDELLKPRDLTVKVEASPGRA